MTFLGQVTYNQLCSDIWGYAANNKEYALVGLYNGVSIVDVTDPINPVELQYLPGPGPGSDWWDIKVWDTHAYVTNEGGGGLMIIDLSNLPGTVTSTTWTAGGFVTAHNLFIDENGVAYICGMDNLSGGVLMLDVDANPTNPPILGNYTQRYVHDLYVRNDTMWTAEVNDAIFSVVDVSNKANPQVMANKATSGATSHNIWLSDDGNYVLTTDEVSDGNIDAYDVSNLNNIVRLDVFQSSPGQNVIPHNVFYRGNFGVISYYRDGVVIVDATYPDNLIEVGSFDTSPSFSGDGFNGCWGVYPYLPSGNIIASDIEEGLYVLGVNYIQSAQLQGTITDSITNIPINAANVRILNTSTSTNSGSNGKYTTGVFSSGVYDVLYSKNGYISHVEPNVALQNGQRVTKDVKLTTNYVIPHTVTVVDSATGQPIEGADVRFVSASGSFIGNYTTNSNGAVSINLLAVDYYDVFVGKWGFVTKRKSGVISDSTSTVILSEGYYDDFIFDFGWTESSVATTGAWERDIPFGTDFAGAPSNPGQDVAYDYGSEAFVTGNSTSNSAGDDDIDGGATTLFSPYFDLSTYTDPILRYARWFYNDGGSSTPNDYMNISIQTANGNPVLLEELNNNQTPGANNWTARSVRLIDFVFPTDSMRLIIEAADDAPGHLVEGGFDAFRVFDSIPPVFPPDASFTTSVSSICAGSTVVFNDISTENPSAWQWSFPGGFPATSTQQNPAVTYNNSGSYDAELIVSNSMGADTLLLTGFIQVNELPQPYFDITPPSCSGETDGSIQVLDSSNTTITSYNWSTGSVNNAVSGLSAGSYTVTITNADGCLANKTAILSNPLPLRASDITTPASSNTATDGTASVIPTGGTPPYSISWPGDLTDGTSQSNLATGIYEVSITDFNGCSITQDVFVMQNTGTGLEIFSDNKAHSFEVYPNPFTQHVLIKAPIHASLATNIRILDAQGAEVFATTLVAGASLKWGNAMPAGTYLVHIMCNDDREIFKVVKTDN